MGLKFSRGNTFDLARLHLSEHPPLPTLRNDCFYKWDFGPELCEACPSILVWWVHRPPSLAQNSIPGTVEKNKDPLGPGQGESQSPGEPTEWKWAVLTQGDSYVLGQRVTRAMTCREAPGRGHGPTQQQRAHPRRQHAPGSVLVSGHGRTGWALPP